jgi:cytochrome c
MKRLPRTILPLLVSVLALSILGCSAKDPVRQGRALVKKYCSSCHAIGTTDKSKHPGAPPFRTLGGSFELDQFSRQLERGIASGHRDMPEFKFNEDDARAVSAYLRTIQQ